MESSNGPILRDSGQVCMCVGKKKDCEKRVNLHFYE